MKRVNSNNYLITIIEDDRQLEINPDLQCFKLNDDLQVSKNDGKIILLKHLFLHVKITEMR